MLLDIVFIMIIVFLFLLGRKRAVTLEFFQTFKFLLILFLMEFFHRAMGKIFIKYMKNTRNNLEIYIINFIINTCIIILNVFIDRGINFFIDRL